MPVSKSIPTRPFRKHSRFRSPSTAGRRMTWKASRKLDKKSRVRELWQPEIILERPETEMRSGRTWQW